MSMMSEGGIPREELEATFGKKVAANDWYVILIEYEGFGEFIPERFSHI